MENLEQWEVSIDQHVFEEPIVLSATEDEIAGGVDGEVEKGVFKCFNNKLYNQKIVDAFSCTLVSAFTALSNGKNVDVPVELMQEAFKEYHDSGKFTPWVWGSLVNGAEFALKHFNRHFGTNVKYECLPFTIQNGINAIKWGFPFTSWIKYGKEYFKDEQDDATIQAGEGVVGNNGHAIAFVKINTMDDQLVKFTENYHGLLKYDIILADFVKNRDLFFRTMIRFYE